MSGELQNIVTRLQTLDQDKYKFELERANGMYRDYKVHTVKGMLKTLLRLDNGSDLTIKLGLPAVTLEGLVNGTHTVNLENFSRNLEYCGVFLKPGKPSLADERIADTSRFILTED